MKKIISLLLVLVLCAGLLSTAAFAAEEKSETFIFNGSNEVEGDYFNLKALYSSEMGWCGGSGWYTEITAKENGVRITHVDAHVNDYGHLYYNVGVSGGQKVPESLGAAKTGDVSVININDKSFSFRYGKLDVKFDRITVYYETCEEDGHFYNSDNVCVGCDVSKCEAEGHSFDPNNVCVNCKLTKCEIEGHHSFGEDNVCGVCGLTKCEIEGHHSFGEDNVCGVCRLTKCDVEGHSLENGFCKFCDFFDESKHEHIFDDNNNCVCGKTKCDVEGHDYEKGVCTVCQHECENEFHNGVYVCPDCYMEFDPTQGNPLVRGSTLSQGNMTIVVGVACAAVFGFGGFLLGRKKKPAVASGANSEDEE